VVTVPLAPRTARAIDLAIGEHTDGPLFLAADGRRLDRHGAGRIVRTTARRAGITKNVTPHTLRHAFITAAQVSRVASGASFGSSREHALPAAQRAALGCPRPAGTPRGCVDLGLHGPPGSDATMMQLIPLRGLHHHCACWHRDASASSRLHRVHHRRAPRAAAGRHHSCEGPAGPPHHWSRHAPDLATSPLVAPGASPPPETDVRAAVSSPVSHAVRRRGRRAAAVAATHRSGRPADASGLDQRHGWADPYP
jgi:hypothetical protein